MPSVLDYTRVMNLLIIDKTTSDNATLRVVGRQLAHLLNVRKSVVGDTIRVGRLNGQMGEGKIIAINDDFAPMKVL